MRLIGYTVLTILVSYTYAASNPWMEYKELLQHMNNDAGFKAQWDDHMKLFAESNVQQGIKFSPLVQPITCQPSRSDKTPTSVRQLLPGDIKVIGALGDSITAGNGIKATLVPGVLIEYRGHSFSGGGYKTYNEGVITLPNILRYYNPGLYGYALDKGSVDNNNAKFNRAIPGSVAPDIPKQVNDLVTKMMGDKMVNYDDDWKMVTLFVGGNDLCEVCDDEEKLGPDSYIKNIEIALGILYHRMPRTIVNVLASIDITISSKLSTNIICDLIHKKICPCAAPEHAQKIKSIQKEYASKLSDLINSGVYEKDDFTVVYHPFLRDTTLPKKSDGSVDLSYIAPDCFHWSEKGHQALARNLWNNLFLPVNQKPTSGSFHAPLKCPQKGEYLQTNPAMSNVTVSPIVPTMTPPFYMSKAFIIGMATLGAVLVVAVIAIVCAIIVPRMKKSAVDAD